MSDAPPDRPLTSHQEDLLGELFIAFENHPQPAGGDDLDMSSLPAEGLVLSRWFSRIANASERAVVVRLAQALAERKSADH